MPCQIGSTTFVPLENSRSASPSSSPLWPLLAEEAGTEDHDPEPTLANADVNLSTQTVAQGQFELIQPDLQTVSLQRVSEGTRNVLLVLRRMANEDVVGHVS